MRERYSLILFCLSSQFFRIFTAHFFAPSYPIRVDKVAPQPTFKDALPLFRYYGQRYVRPPTCATRHRMRKSEGGFFPNRPAAPPLRTSPQPPPSPRGRQISVQNPLMQSQYGRATPATAPTPHPISNDIRNKNATNISYYFFNCLHANLTPTAKTLIPCIVEHSGDEQELGEFVVGMKESKFLLFFYNVEIENIRFI